MRRQQQHGPVPPWHLHITTISPARFLRYAAAISAAVFPTAEGLVSRCEPVGARVAPVATVAQAGVWWCSHTTVGRSCCHNGNLRGGSTDNADLAAPGTPVFAADPRWKDGRSPAALPPGPAGTAVLGWSTPTPLYEEEKECKTKLMRMFALANFLAFWSQLGCVKCM